MRKNIFIKILLPTALVFLLLGAVSPTLAHTSTQTYNFISVGYSKVPGEETVVDNVLYVKGSVGTGVNYGYPWGKEATHTQRNNFYLNQTDYTGKLIGYIEKEFCRGDLRMIGRAEFIGVGLFTYNGPTITANGTDTDGNTSSQEIQRNFVEDNTNSVLITIIAVAVTVVVIALAIAVYRIKKAKK